VRDRIGDIFSAGILLISGLRGLVLSVLLGLKWNGIISGILIMYAVERF
jgi:hypothetical protein